eukprot:2113515-Pleurochrysis_carterae.AAC.3
MGRADARALSGASLNALRILRPLSCWAAGLRCLRAVRLRVAGPVLASLVRLRRQSKAAPSTTRSTIVSHVD